MTPEFTALVLIGLVMAAIVCSALLWRALDRTERRLEEKARQLERVYDNRYPRPRRRK
ncbi:hypothetical protein [Deinococcus radiophilus]|uniref:hypothetical protein n=1 Tax=Deinococcus radiophilus TaxID=32062 RepID=UPI001475248F|nr:hypothetical protein [Deinococcus radiophilus]UFA49625.1 hypothetical protein LMT64_06885 [Deinococcus radiophilus]